MILEVTTIAQGNDRINVEVRSLIDGYRDSFTTYINRLDHRLNIIRAARMKRYLTNFLKSRMTAYEKMEGTHDPRYQRIKDLHHHMANSNKKWQDFMQWVMRREDTLLAALPTKVNASHTKVTKILQICKEIA